MKRTWLVSDYDMSPVLYMTLENEKFKYWFVVRYELDDNDALLCVLVESHHNMNHRYTAVEPNGDLSVLNHNQIDMIKFVEAHPGIEFDPLWDRTAR